MNFNSFDLIQKIVLYAIPLLFAITVHEVAHGWVASKCGDQTARMLGRLSLNPIKHIDPIGTILVPALTMYFTGFIFGWAKPVPVNWSNLRNQRRTVPLVALAGPGANLLMALGWGIIAKIGVLLGGELGRAGQVFAAMGIIGVQVNVVLMILNLLPFPPLDGSRVVMNFLPGRWIYEIQRFEQFGFIILMLLLVTGILGTILWPLIQGMNSVIFTLVGIG